MSLIIPTVPTFMAHQKKVGTRLAPFRMMMLPRLLPYILDRKSYMETGSSSEVGTGIHTAPQEPACI